MTTSPPPKPEMMPATTKHDSLQSTALATTIAYYGAFLALGMSAASLGPTLPALAENTQSTISQVSLLFTTRGLGYLLGSMRGGHWYDRLPGHRVMFLVLLLMAILLALVPVVPVLWLLAVFMSVLGFGEGTLDVGANTLLVWLHQKRVAPFMNGLHLFFAIGAVIAPIFVAQSIVLSRHIHWAYWGIAILMLPVIIFLSRQPSPTIPHAAGGGDHSRNADFVMVILVMAFFFINFGAEGSLGGWIYSYALSLGLGTETTAAYLTSIFWGGLTAGRLISVPLATRFSPRAILLADVLGALASITLMIFSQHSYVLTLVGVFAAGAFMASIIPTAITFAGSYLPTSGRTTGWFFVGGSLGNMFFPWLIGQLFEPVGAPVTMWVEAAAMLAGLGIFIAMLLRVRKPPQP